MDTLLQHGLVAVFLAILLTPFGLPVPEEVSLLAAGALVRGGHAEPHLALLAGYAGILCADTIAWTYGNFLGLHPTGFVGRIIGPEDIERIERFYRRFGPWAIFITRQVPGLRLAGFFFAGASGIPLRRFLAFDAPAGIVTAGVYVSLGRAFADDLGRIVAFLDQVRIVGAAVVVAAIGLAVWRIARRRGS